MQHLKFTLLPASLTLLAACSIGSSAPPPVAGGPTPQSLETFDLHILHTSPDAPAVSLSVTSGQANARLLANGADYKEGTGADRLVEDSHTVRVAGLLPVGTAAEIRPLYVDFAAQTLYSNVAAGDVANVAPIFLTQPNTPIPAGNVRQRGLHAAPLPPQVDVYATAPGADLAASPPIGSFSFGEHLGPIEAPADDYQVRVSLPDNPDAVVFDYGTVALADGSDLLVAAVEGTATDDSPISLVVMTGSGAAEIRDVDALDPALANVPLAVNTGLQSLAAGTYDKNIAPTGTTVAANSVEGTIEAGGVYTAIAHYAAGGGLPLDVIGLDDWLD